MPSCAAAGHAAAGREPDRGLGHRVEAEPVAASVPATIDEARTVKAAEPPPATARNVFEPWAEASPRPVVAPANTSR